MTFRFSRQSRASGLLNTKDWDMLHLDEHASGSTVHLRPGEELEIALSEGRMTGFRWILEEDGSPSLELLEDTPEVHSRAVGAPGVRRWRFQAGQAGQAQLRIAYLRPWEKKPPAFLFSLHVTVEP
jgi:predicted secreted protein